MKPIGPKFADELRAAGVSLDGFAWSSDGTFNWNDLPEEQRVAVLVVYDAHDPAIQLAPLRVTPLQFIERFTEAEQLSIVTAAMTTPALRLWYDKLMAAQEVVFADPRLSAGLDALVTAGLITAERKAELLLP